MIKEENRKLIREMYDNGKSIKEISKKVKLKDITIEREISKYKEEIKKEQEERKLIREMYDNGLSIEDISKMVKLSYIIIEQEISKYEKEIEIETIKINKEEIDIEEVDDFRIIYNQYTMFQVYDYEEFKKVLQYFLVSRNIFIHYLNYKNVMKLISRYDFYKNQLEQENGFNKL